jgi:hypothetical protein
VLGSALHVAEPLAIVLAAAVGDVSLSVVRRLRRARREPKRLAPRAPA